MLSTIRGGGIFAQYPIKVESDLRVTNSAFWRSSELREKIHILIDNRGALWAILDGSFGTILNNLRRLSFQSECLLSTGIIKMPEIKVLALPIATAPHKKRLNFELSGLLILSN